MPRYTISPEAFLPPTSFSPYFRVSFRLPFESRDPIYPASGLQFSFARPSDGQEIFLARRMTARDVQRSDAGLCTLVLGREDVPRYTAKTAIPQEGGEKEERRQDEEQEEEVMVRLHAWRGEKHLGAWEVGRLSGGDVSRVVQCTD